MSDGRIVQTPGGPSVRLANSLGRTATDADTAEVSWAWRSPTEVHLIGNGYAEPSEIRRRPPSFYLPIMVDVRVTGFSPRPTQAGDGCIDERLSERWSMFPST